MHFKFDEEEEKKTVINSTSNYLSSETLFSIIWYSILVLWCCHRTIFSSNPWRVGYMSNSTTILSIEAAKKELVLNVCENQIRNFHHRHLHNTGVYKNNNANFSSCPSQIYRPLWRMHKNNEIVWHEISHRNKLVLGMHVRTYLSFYLFIYRKQFWTFIIIFVVRVWVCLSNFFGLNGIEAR